MALSSRTWLISAVTAAGVAGGAAIGVSQAPGQAPVAAPSRAVANTQPNGLDGLHAQVQYLLAQERGLRADLAQARARLAARLRAAAPPAVTGSQPASTARLLPSGGSAPRQVPTSTAPRTQAPTTHGTTGASGVSSPSPSDDAGEHGD